MERERERLSSHSTKNTLAKQHTHRKTKDNSLSMAPAVDLVLY